MDITTHSVQEGIEYPYSILVGIETQFKKNYHEMKKKISIFENSVAIFCSVP